MGWDGVQRTSWDSMSSGKILLHKLGSVFVMFHNILLQLLNIKIQKFKKKRNWKATSFKRMSSRPRSTKCSRPSISRWASYGFGVPRGHWTHAQRDQPISDAPGDAKLAFLPREFRVASEERAVKKQIPQVRGCRRGDRSGGVNC